MQRISCYLLLTTCCHLLLTTCCYYESLHLPTQPPLHLPPPLTYRTTLTYRHPFFSSLTPTGGSVFGGLAVTLRGKGFGVLSTDVFISATPACLFRNVPAVGRVVDDETFVCISPLWQSEPSQVITQQSHA